MDQLHSMEIAVTLFFQSLGGWLTGPMRFFSFFGREEFYLLLMPILYWCVDAAVGLRVGVMLLLAQFTNSFLKLALHGTRPYWFDTRVRALSTETSFGIPSGHSESAAGIWGLMAVLARKGWITAGCLAVIVLVGLSRIYLGVHFLTDVLSGWLIGGLLVLAFIRWEPAVTRWLKTLPLGALVGLAALTSLGTILVSLLPLAIWPNYTVPAIWEQNALAAAPGVKIDPLSIEGVFTIGGTWFGLLAGAAYLYHRWGGFDAGGTGKQRLLRYLIGLVGVLALWYGLGAVFPRSADWVGYTLRYFRYTLIGLWISALAPLLFARLGIAALRRPAGLQESRISL